MQGYIININKVRDEDLIVSIITEENFYTAYRFYGARHSNINIGYKIDFELETNMKSDIPRLKGVLQIGFPWILHRDKMYHWQRFIKLFYPHLKDVDDIDDFYYNLLQNLVTRIEKQDVKRAIIESYVILCDYEGRLHTNFECLLCDSKIDDKISLVRGFAPTHSTCSYSKNFKIDKIKNLFFNRSSISLDDSECDYLYNIIMQGL